MKKYVLTLVLLASFSTNTSYAIRFDEGCSDQDTINLAKQYPQVGILGDFNEDGNRTGLSTATLITIPNLPDHLKNRLIVTAKHCIEFKTHHRSFILAKGENSFSSVEVESFLEAPDIPMGCLFIKSCDIAFGLLKEPMNFIEPLELSYELSSEKEILTTVGYGNYGSSSLNIFYTNNFLTLEQIKPRAIQFYSDEMIRLKRTPTLLPLRLDITVKNKQRDNLIRGITAEGDSGGPLIQETKDGKKKVIGILNGAEHRHFSSSSYYSQLDMPNDLKLWVMKQNVEILKQNIKIAKQNTQLLEILEEFPEVLKQNNQDLLNDREELALINEGDLVCSPENKYTQEFLKSSDYLKKTKGLELFIRNNVTKQIFYSLVFCKDWILNQLDGL